MVCNVLHTDRVVAVDVTVEMPCVRNYYKATKLYQGTIYIFVVLVMPALGRLYFKWTHIVLFFSVI